MTDLELGDIRERHAALCLAFEPFVRAAHALETGSAVPTLKGIRASADVDITYGDLLRLARRRHILNDILVLADEVTRLNAVDTEPDED